MEPEYILVHSTLQLSYLCIILYHNVLFYTMNSKLQFLVFFTDTVKCWEGPPRLLYNGYQVIPKSKAAEA